MLEVSSLTYTYPDTDAPALRDITFSLLAGEVLLLAGGTGAGKSTLCYALAGFAPHFFNGTIQGDVTLGGREMRGTALGVWVQDVGLVVQNPFNQISGARTTVWEEVAFGLENLGVPRDEMAARVGAALAQLEIADLADRSPYALSGGQAQRVAIASILVLRPKLLVLDEPTAQLDPEGTAEVFGVLRGLAAQGATVVLVTHQLGQAAEFATRALVLEAGRIVAEGTARAVLADPRLPEWRVEPPIFAPLAAALRLPAPPPITFAEARAAFAAWQGTHAAGTNHAPPPNDTSINNWPFSPLSSLLSPLPPVSPTPVTVEAVRFAYPNGVAALRGVSLRLEPGQVAALIGANGAGKSTLARTLNGLLRPTSGTVRVGEWDAAARPTSELARRVGYLFQNPDDQLFKATVGEEVAFGPQALGHSETAVAEAVEGALALTGLSELRDVHPYDLHPTQRRWVALASVLAVGAPVLVLDEPTTGLDLAQKQQMAALLATLRAAGYTLLVVSHDMQFVAENADQVWVMAGGEIIAAGDPATVFADDEALRRASVEAAPVARLARALGLGAGVVTARGFVERLIREGTRIGSE